MIGRSALLSAVLGLCTLPAAAEDLAVLQGLDKVTARVSAIEVPVDGSGRFGTLAVTVRACHKAPPDEPPENAAFLEITEYRPNDQAEEIFRGWMFSSSPGLSALEHPIYDISVIECRDPASESPSAAAGDTSPEDSESARSQ